jgi:hypothetical protein
MFLKEVSYVLAWKRLLVVMCLYMNIVSRLTVLFVADSVYGITRARCAIATLA